MRLLFIHFTVYLLFFTAAPIQAQLFEDFEDGEKTSYAAANVELETGTWFFDDALIGTLPQDKKNGMQSARIRNGSINMAFCFPNGMSELRFFAANFSADTGGAIQISYSTNQGNSWTNLGSTIQLTDELTEYVLEENIEGNIRLKFSKTNGNRINVDDILVYDYIPVTENPSILLRMNSTPYENGSTFDFGIVPGPTTAELQIRNTGLEDLVISAHNISGHWFTVDGNLNVTLAHQEAANFDLSFETDEEGVYEGALTLTTNDPQNQTFTLNLTAEALDTSVPITIEEARTLPLGTPVTITGWVTVADQFAGPVYLQDETAGIAWYNKSIMDDEYLVGAVIGDSIVLQGTLSEVNGLIQILDDTFFEVFPEANSIQDPVEINLQQFNSGNYEGSLVMVNEVEFFDTGIFSGGSSYNVYDNTGTGTVRIENTTNIPGTIIPSGLARLTGIAGRHGNSEQLLPRFRNDIEVLSGPIILTTPPYEASATQHSITFEWETMHAGHSEIRYGQTPDFEMGHIVDETHKTSHSITIDGLDAATIYKVQLRSAFDADTSATAMHISSTASPHGSTGAISVFFNKDVAHELATYQEAQEQIAFDQKLIDYINQAEETAEFAFYSISGSVGDAVASAILDAHNRGVTVRVIASGHTGSTNPVIAGLAAAGVPAVQSLGNEQMHNKFAVIDAQHNDPAVPTLITSSWNATDQGTNNQFQNMVIIQDVAITRAYQREFNQMWGAESGSFNADEAKFSYYKEIVNPSIFWIGTDETRVELYFSPQGNTEARINSKISGAASTIDFALNLITRRSITNVMRNRFDEGVTVRGVLGDIGGPASEWGYLSGWADVHHLPQGTFGLLHHKYAIIDGEQGGPNAKIITGSHNWSANANFRNDENTLIIYSARVANEYFQEFGARYWQAGGTDEFDVSTSTDDIVKPGSSSGIQLNNFPNPFKEKTTLNFELQSEEKVSLVIYDIAGRRILNIFDSELMQAGTHEIQVDTSSFNNGFYICRMHTERGSSRSIKMLRIQK